MDDTFLKELIENLAFITKAKYVFIANSRHEAASDVIETITLWSNGKFVENIQFALNGTPCEEVLEGNVRFYSERVQALFPEDEELKTMAAESYLGCPIHSSSGQSFGYIAILDTIPLENEQELITIIQAFTSLACAEFERVQTLQVLSESETFNRVVLENSLDAFIAIDPAGKITKWNKQTNQILTSLLVILSQTFFPTNRTN